MLFLPGGRELGLMTAYLRDGEGLSPANEAILAHIGDHIDAFQQQGIEAIVGGDWNMTPEELGVDSWLDEVGVLLRTSVDVLGTCQKAKGAVRLID